MMDEAIAALVLDHLNPSAKEVLAALVANDDRQIHDYDLPELSGRPFEEVREALEELKTLGIIGFWQDSTPIVLTPRGKNICQVLGGRKIRHGLFLHRPA